MNSRRIIPIICLALFIVLSTSPLSADRAIIPVPPLPIYEPGQYGIIAWNGNVELLILTTEILTPLAEPDVGNSYEIIEFLPLPSIPEVELAPEDIFMRVAELLQYERIERTGGFEGSRAQGLMIVFEKKLGPHEITLIASENSEDVVDFLLSKAEERGVSLGNIERFMELVRIYIEEGYKFFSVDIISISPTKVSSLNAGVQVKPVAYVFNSENLYYPMRITKVIEGYTTVNLILFTERKINYIDVREAGFEVLLEGKLPSSDIFNTYGKFSQILGGTDEVYATYIRYEGDVGGIKRDLLISGEPSIWETIGYLFLLSPPIITAVTLLITDRVVWSKDEKKKRVQGNVAEGIFYLIGGLIVLVPFLILSPRLLEEVPRMAVSMDGLVLLMSLGILASSGILSLFTFRSLIRQYKGGKYLAVSTSTLFIINPLAIVTYALGYAKEIYTLWIFMVFDVGLGIGAFIFSLIGAILVTDKWRKLP